MHISLCLPDAHRLHGGTHTSKSNTRHGQRKTIPDFCFSGRFRMFSAINCVGCYRRCGCVHDLQKCAKAVLLISYFVFPKMYLRALRRYANKTSDQINPAKNFSLHMRACFFSVAHSSLVFIISIVSVSSRTL